MPQPLVAIRPRLAELIKPLLSSLNADVVAAADTLPEGTRVLLQTAMDPMPASAIQAAPASLGLIANLGVGFDNIDLPAAAARGVMVSNTPVVTEDTADLAFALLLAAARRLTASEALLRADEWEASQRVIGTRVHGKTLGIVGFGAIGQAVARRARGFDMAIAYYGPRTKEAAASALDARYVSSVEELVAQCDFVSLHCPLTAATRHTINKGVLAKFKPGAILINTGRGPLIHEAALIDALQSGALGGAGLDVFEFEPQVSEGLLEFDNVTLLPHIGSATGECRLDIVMRGIANVRAFLADGVPVDRVVD